MTSEFIQKIANLMENEIIRNFVENEAYEQISKDINKKIKGSSTAAAARLIVHREGNENMHERWLQYVAAGYAGVLAAK